MDWSIISVFMTSVLMGTFFVSVRAEDSVMNALPRTTDRMSVALTFDDGPSPKTTPQILRILKQYDVKATFFVVGRMAKQYPKLIQQIIAEGHTLGNHSFGHVNLKRSSSHQIRRELVATNQAIARATTMGRANTESSHHSCSPVVLFRPPYGLHNQQVVTMARNLGMKTVLWSVDTRDWQNPAPHTILRRVKSQLKPRSIVLLHDLHLNTVKALPDIIEHLHNKHYRIISLDALRASSTAAPLSATTVPSPSTAASASPT